MGFPKPRKRPPTVFLPPLLGLLVGDDLSDVLHDEGALLDVLQGLDPPPAAVRGAEDGQPDLPALLDDAVVAIFRALALLVALVDRHAHVQPQFGELGVGKQLAEGVGAARLLGGQGARALALAADGRVVGDDDAWNEIGDVDGFPVWRGVLLPGVGMYFVM